jgi:hypothetical protein
VATKSHRAGKFAEWLTATFGTEVLSQGTGVLDVAGGRGDVSFELHTVRGVPCTLVEPRWGGVMCCVARVVRPEELKSCVMTCAGITKPLVSQTPDLFFVATLLLGRGS